MTKVDLMDSARSQPKGSEQTLAVFPFLFFFFLFSLAGFHNTVRHTGSFFFYIRCWFFFTHFLAFIDPHGLAGHFSSALVAKVVVVFQFPSHASFLPLLPGRLSSTITPCVRTLCSPSSALCTYHHPIHYKLSISRWYHYHGPIRDSLLSKFP